jgi:ECF sigma factor
LSQLNACARVECIEKTTNRYNFRYTTRGSLGQASQVIENGGRGRDRTGDPLLAKRTLLHQAYLDFAERNDGPSFPDRARFMGYASRVMRGLIIDHARNCRAQKLRRFAKF